MPDKRTHIRPDQKLELDLTPAERKAILDHLHGLASEHVALLGKTRPEQPLLLTLDDLDEFAGYVAAASNHTADKKLGKVLDSAYKKMEALLDRFTVEPPAASPVTKRTKPTKRAAPRKKPGK